MQHALFVYGTLRPGHANEHILKVIGGIFEPATVKGTLFPKGWLDGFPYPGIDLDEAGDEIPGFIFTSPHLPTYWGRLDAFEGDHYKRVETTALTGNGTPVLVNVYVIKRNP